MKNFAKRLVAGVFALFSLALVAIFLLEAIARISAEKRFTPEGHLVDLGSHSLHVVIKGEGGPTVVFESGLDSYGYLPWFKVQEAVSEHTTTLAYDRAGILWSDESEYEKSLNSIANDLTTLLELVEAPKPYIVVGHSVAGITLRQFIARNIEDISGIVFVDVSHPTQTDISPPKVPPRILMTLMSNSGFIRRASAGRLYPNTDKEDFINKIGPALMHRSTNGQYDEAARLLEMSNEAREIDSFLEVPLVVISATAGVQNLDKMEPEQKEIAELRKKMQEDLLRLSTDSRQILAKQSNHYVQLEEPQLVIEAILEIIAD